MTELKPTHLLVVVGVLALALPWLLHWDTTRFRYIRLESAYLTLIYCSLVTGLISTIGSLRLLSRNAGDRHSRDGLLIAFFCGALGLYSLFFVFFLSMN